MRYDSTRLRDNGRRNLHQRRGGNTALVTFVLMEGRMKKTTIRLLIVLGISLLILASPGPAAPQLQTVPGSAVRGERTLNEAGCLSCHALNSRGGTRGPDLAKPSRTAATPALFATSLWNHAPSMLSQYAESNKPAPQLRSDDVADLFAYFYATLYFSPKGDVSRGGSLFISRQCASCHSEVLDTSRRGALRETWMDLKDPSVWAERMWNHATEMDTAMANRGIRWPRLSDHDVVDLMVFLSTQAGTQPEAEAFTIGEPELGQPVFESSCASCHTVGKSEQGKVDLLSRTAPGSVTGYIAAMWNHAPQMRRRGGNTPKLSTGQMSHLIAYLFSQRYFFEPGDKVRGKRVFEDKSCATCHEVRRLETGAPDLTRLAEAFSPITLSAAAWSHGLPMMNAMKQQHIDWPEFKGREMADLIAYLNSRLIVRLASKTERRAK
jgi:mono/diheme cytochrome c family protein